MNFKIINAIIFFLTVSSSCFDTAQAFTTANPITTSSVGRSRTTQQNMLPLDTTIGDSSFLVDSTSMLLGAIKNPSMQFVISEMANKCVNPSVQSQILTDVSHVVSDFSGIFKPSKSMFKACAVAGRILSILADYIEDHSVHSEELVVQLILLGVGIHDLVKELQKNNY